METTIIQDIADELSTTTAKQEEQVNNNDAELSKVVEDIEKYQNEEVKEEELTEEKKPEDTEEKKEEAESLIEFVEEAEKKEDAGKGFEAINETLKEIGVEPITSTSELKDYISSLKNENEANKQKASEIYATEEIRDLNEYVKQGGDLKSYTNDLQNISKYEQTLGYLDKMTPIDAYKQSIVLQYGVSDFSQLPQEKQEQINDFIELKNPIEIEIEGKKIINAEKLAYQQEIDKLNKGIETSKQNLQKKNEVYASSVSKTIQSLTGVDGIKVSATEKQELATILKDPKKALAEIMPLDEHGLPDADALVKIIYRAKYGERNLKFLQKKAESKGSEKVFNKISNATPKEVAPHSKSVKESDPVDEAVSQV